MKDDRLLTIMSLFTLLLLTVHIADDIRLGMAPPGLTNMIVIVISVVWLYGTLVLAGRLSGYIVVLVGSLLAAVVPVVHMNGPNGMLGSRVSASGHAVFFIWTCLAIGATSAFSALLAGRSLSSLHSGQSR
jgi:hypothetical protein